MYSCTDYILRGDKMKKIIKIFIDEKEEHNPTEKDVVALQNILRGDITQISESIDLCKNCESDKAGKEYCESCKANEFNLFAIKQE